MGSIGGWGIKQSNLAHSIGEESYAAGARPELTDVPTFCVDPIGIFLESRFNNQLDVFVDGTTNFVHGFPFVCISLGLIYKQRPVLGVIYNPFLDHLVCRNMMFTLSLKPLFASVHRDQRPGLLPYTQLENAREAAAGCAQTSSISLPSSHCRGMGL